MVKEPFFPPLPPFADSVAFGSIVKKPLGAFTERVPAEPAPGWALTLSVVPEAKTTFPMSEERAMLPPSVYLVTLKSDLLVPPVFKSPLP